MAAIEIIAEIANAHQGDPALAIALGEAALEAGADAIKFQVYTADELLVRAHPRYEHFRRQSFSAEIWARLFGHFAARRARVYADIFGFDALAACRGAAVAGYKIHSSDLANTPLLAAAAADGRPMLLSVGGSTLREIETALAVATGAGVPVTLLHGFQSYPTNVEDSALDRLRFLQAQFGARARIGYADHVAGGDSFATTLPAMAVALGVAVIEKHVTFDRAAKGVDWYSSIEPEEFRIFVADIRRAGAALGGSPLAFAPSEREYRRTVKKHWVTRRALAAGHALAADDLVMKRVAGHAAEPVELDKLVGRPLLRAVGEETPLTRADVPVAVWGCVVARMRSARLPGKALIDMAGVPALAHLLRRVKQIPGLAGIALCTTTEADDDPIAAIGAAEGVYTYRGPVLDVLGRMLGAVEGKGADIVLRITGDDILLDPDYAAEAIAHHRAHNAEYTDLKALPSGTELEVFDAALLRALWASARDRDGTEYLTTYVTASRDQFRTASCPVASRHAQDWRLTLDTPEDLQVIRALLEAMRAAGKPLDYRMDDVADFFERHPGALAANAMVRQRATPIDVHVDLDWSKMAASAP